MPSEYQLRDGIKGKMTKIVCQLSEFFYFCKSNFNIYIMRRQLILEHKTSKTTEIYTHVSENNFKNFKNPIDYFEI